MQCIVNFDLYSVTCLEFVTLSYPCSPCGKKFRSKPQIARFLGECADLSAFDFSRAGTPGDGTQRRRARDRSSKKVDILRAVPLVRPLSINPLRPSGPIRRTCGVIKLPVTWVYIPTPSDEENETSLKQTSAKETPPSEENKPSPITPLPVTTSASGVVVPALWESRLLGVKPCDHETGDDINPPVNVQNGTTAALTPNLTHKLTESNTAQNLSPTPLIPGIPNSTQKQVSTIKSPPSLSVSGVTASILAQQLQQSLKQAVGMSSSTTVIPSLLQHSGRMSPSSGTLKNGQSKNQDTSASHLTGSDIVLLSLGKTVKPSLGRQNLSPPVSVTSASVVTNGPSTLGSKKVLENLSRLVTDNDLRLQEEKVRHLRQQLLAAERN